MLLAVSCVVCVVKCVVRVDCCLLRVDVCCVLGVVSLSFVVNQRMLFVV